MRLVDWYNNHFVKTVVFATIALTLAFTLDSVDLMVTRSSYGRTLKPATDGTLTWNISTGGLKAGHYYLSAGRVKGECEAYSDGVPLASSEVTPDGPLQSLMLGVAFDVASSENKKISINCPEQPGFRNGLADEPTLLPYNLGKALEIYRALIYLFLGPIVGLYLLVECINPFSETPETSQVLKRPVRYSILCFSLISFAYALSLGRVPRLFFDNYSSTCLHIILRGLVALSFIEIVARFNKRSWLVTWLYAFFISSDLLISIFCVHSPQTIVLFYKWHYAFFALSTLYVWSLLVKRRIYSRAVDWLQVVAGVWSLTQAIDAFFTVFDYGTYKSPLLIVLITGGLVILRRKEIWVAARIELAVKRILETMSSNTSMGELLSKSADAVFEETSFKRFSVYLDFYCLGKSDQPHRRFERIAEHGYNKDTKVDTYIDFDDGRGAVMSEAMATGKIIFRKGIDKCWYCVVPIGKLGCINLSNDITTSVVLAHESREIVARLRTVIDSLADKLLVDTIRRNTYLERIKGIKGCGEWPVTLGAIFLDVVDFSSSVKKYKLLSGGTDVFGRFLTATYFPALLKAVGEFAQLEKSVGDLLYLVVIPELLPKGKDVDSALIDAIHLLGKFVAIDGARLCMEAGFAPIRLRVGSYIGDGTIICDEFQVRTVGDSVNFAARLLENAPTGAYMIPQKIALSFTSASFRSAGSREVLENKDYLVANVFYYDDDEKSA